MTIEDAKLMAYADGELSPEERAEIERAAATDASVRARIAAHRKLSAGISNAYAEVLEESLPASLRDAPYGQARQVQVVDIAARRASRPHWSAREWGAMAASLIAGVLVSYGVMIAQAPPIAVTAEGMGARGALERALETQLASDQAGAVRIGLTFRSKDGGYCRTFDLTRRGTSGLACRADDGWNVALTAATPPQGDVRMAGGDEYILSSVDRMIQGEPLDADAEVRARDGGWR
jgi:hypothetical protein